MDPLPIQYLHLETLVTPLFLIMVLLIQLARGNEPGYYIQKGRKQILPLILGFCVLTVVFGALLHSVSPVLAIELAAGATLSLLHPANALCFFVHLLFLRPWEIATTNVLLLSLPRVLALLCVFSWLLHPKQHARPSRWTLRTLLWLLVFTVWLFLTTFEASNILDAQAYWFNSYFRAIIVFVMCLFFIESEKSVLQLQGTVVISVLALMFVRIYQYSTEGNSFVRLGTGGLFGDPNDLSSIIVMAIPFALVPALKKTAHLGGQLMGALFTGLSLFVIWHSQSRGAMLAVVVQLLTVGFLRTPRRHWPKLLILAGILCAGYVVVLKAIPREADDMSASTESRITYWKTAVNMTLHRPFAGVGFNQYPYNYDSYSVGTKHEWGLRTAHSSWFLVFAETGIPGGLLFLVFIWATLKTTWRHRERRVELLYAMVGYGMTMSFLSHTYVMYPYLLSGLILASDSLPADIHGS